MQLNSLAPKTKNKKPAPVGRGGKRGKTSGRGGKGQTARALGHTLPLQRWGDIAAVAGVTIGNGLLVAEGGGGEE